MWKYSKHINCKCLFMQIIALSISLNEAAICTDCSNTILRTESVNITYGPSNEYSCNCDWTIPEDMDTDHETAVVLLLQNFSLPRTTSSSTTHCSGRIRFPSTDGYKCEFASNYCLVFETTSTTCNINKIREKIPVANHTSFSIGLNEAVRCTDCSPKILETESKNITYGPGNEYNCNCDWTIPTSMDTDHETAVVLLLQNVSLPRTTGIGSTDCSGEIRFPSKYNTRIC
ncbi:uncharacterized protein LOC144429792 [Styela clava]